MSRKEFPLVFTVQKLRKSLEDLSRTTEGPAYKLSPIYSAAAPGPMTMPSLTDTQWEPVEVGQLWGLKHGTSWLMTHLHVPSSMQRLPLILQLQWDFSREDPLLLSLDATVFLDGRAIGAFDWKHRDVVLPEEACDGESHTLMLQVYTSDPQPFGGLTLRPRLMLNWHLYHLMQTLLEVCLALDEDDLARHVLLGRLNTAYNMLDLREGWQSERFNNTAQAAIDYLQTHLLDGLSGGNRPRITASGHGHLDIGWMWPYWRTRQKIAHTVSNVLGLMERYPNFYYSQSQPQVLQWLKEDVPELYARVKRRVAEGRFEPVGAMWVEADCNLTSGESLIRQIMHGMRFWRQEFGVRPRHIWLPDVFGYSAAFPQIMRGCNIPVFMTTKISWNQFNRIPFDTFRWRGIDGTEVLTHFITAPDIYTTTTFYTYNGALLPDGVKGTWKNYRQKDINDDLLYLYGWGDGGGGPTEDQVERLQIMKDLPDFPQVRAGRAEEYFRGLYERVWENPRLPTWVGELYLEYHRGTYTSQARIKQANRRSELFYRNVELLSAWASLYGMPSRQEQLNQGWRLVLLNQFHDVLPGSSIREVYDDAERIYEEARAIGKGIYDEALAVVLQHVPAGGQGLLLLNTLMWERTDPVQVPGKLEGSLPQIQQTTDWDGNSVALLDGIRILPCGVQVVSLCSDTTIDEAEISSPLRAAGSLRPASARSTSHDLAALPIRVAGCEALAATGWRCRAEQEQAGLIDAGTDVEKIILQNEYYELWIDARGEMSRLYDRRAEREVFAPGQTGNQLIAYEDRPLNFDAWDIDLFYEEKPYAVQSVTTIHITEEGPVRATVEIVRRYMSSHITQRISLWRSSPRIDIATEIDWYERQTLLKAAFPLAINNTRATYEIQFGNVERPTHRNTSWDLARFETYAHRWIDLSEGGYGVSLLNDSKYGHDVHDNVVRLTLLKSSIFPDAHADEGLHRFTYSLLPHVGDWREAQSVRHGYELNVPVVCVTGQRESASIPRVPTEGKTGVSFMEVDCANVVVETVKPAEDGDGLIVRLYEAHNQRGHGTLSFISPLLAVQECNLLEEHIRDVRCQGNTLSFQVEPFEIKTYRVHLAAEVSYH